LYGDSPQLRRLSGAIASWMAGNVDHWQWRLQGEGLGVAPPQAVFPNNFILLKTKLQKKKSSMFSENYVFINNLLENKIQFHH